MTGLAVCAALGLASAPASAQAGSAGEAQEKVPAQTKGDVGTQNEKICEDIVPVGSRLAKKRFCGTRAEWADRKRQDREALEKAQMSPCVRDGSTCK